MMGMFSLCMKQILRILQVILITGGYTTTRDLETVEVPFVHIPTKEMKTKIIDAQVLGGGEASCSPPSLPMGSACHNTFYTQVPLESIHSLSISRDGLILTLPIFKFLFTVSTQSMAGKSSKMLGLFGKVFPNV